MTRSRLWVMTTGESEKFYGDDADLVYGAISNAGARGNAWTVPVALSTGVEVTFVIDNITHFYYTGGNDND